jgi:hypothetical protein
VARLIIIAAQMGYEISANSSHEARKKKKKNLKMRCWFSAVRMVLAQGAGALNEYVPRVMIPLGLAPEVDYDTA